MAAPEAGTYVATGRGNLRERRLSPDAQARLWGHALHAGAEGLVEVAAGRRRADGSLAMRSRSAADHFPAAGDLEPLARLVRRHREQGDEVFCTPLSRRRPRSGKAGEVLPGRVVWVDIDQSARLERLRSFPHRPHLVVYSGSGGAHAYWRLAERLPPEALEEANRKLAHRLGADPAVTDRARIMRVPGSFNHKAGRACRLAFCDLARPPIPVARLVAGLTDPDPPPPPPTAAERRRHAAMIAGDEAARIPPPAYFRALAGLEVPERGGHVACPLPDHHDQLASCMVYRDPSEGWHCYGCGRGGTVYDLASLLAGGRWGRDLRGQDFKELKRRVQRELGLEPPPAAALRRGGGLQEERRRADSINSGGNG
jgi:RepB DNA-primase from phage plasmid